MFQITALSCFRSKETALLDAVAQFPTHITSFPGLNSYITTPQVDTADMTGGLTYSYFLGQTRFAYWYLVSPDPQFIDCGLVGPGDIVLVAWLLAVGLVVAAAREFVRKAGVL